MVQKLQLDGRQAWLKSYAVQPRARRVMTRAWNVIAGGLEAQPLRSPPRHVGEAAKQVELRRIRELQARDVLVPEVLGEGRDTLLLGDIGPSLSSRLKQVAGSEQADLLVHDTVAEMVAAHRRGAYFGQAFARNITVADGRIGFIDFEEDPLEVMPLRDAQARDWLMFTAGISRYYEDRGEALAGMLEQSVPQVSNEVADEVRHLVDRLGFLHGFARHLGRHTRILGMAVFSLRKGFGMLLLVLGLLIDVALDGESDVFNALQALL